MNAGRSSRGGKTRRGWMVAGIILVMVVLHQDVWFWRDATLVFGFLPIGLAYHAGYSLLAAGAMALLVLLAWPAHLERTPAKPDRRRSRR